MVNLGEEYMNIYCIIFKLKVFFIIKIFQNKKLNTKILEKNNRSSEEICHSEFYQRESILFTVNWYFLCLLPS